MLDHAQPTLVGAWEDEQVCYEGYENPDKGEQENDRTEAGD